MLDQFVAVTFKTHAKTCLCNSVNVSTLFLPSTRSFNPTPPILQYSSWWTPLQEEEEEDEVRNFVQYLIKHLYCMCLHNIILPLLYWDFHILALAVYAAQPPQYCTHACVQLKCSITAQGLCV